MKLNNNNKKIGFMLITIVIFQILLLINMTAAQSYIIHQSDPLIENIKTIKENKNLEDNIKTLINTGASLLIGFLSIKQIGSVSAREIPEVPGIYENSKYNMSYAAANLSLDDITWNCCPLTKEGAICQEIGSMYADSCISSPLPTKCEQVSQCKLGCCIDEDEGLCSTKSPMQICESDGGKWEDEENCLIQECQKGCCVLGNQVSFVTEQTCKHQSLLFGFETDFRGYATELSCLVLSATQFKGACMTDNGGCSIKTETECLSNGGDFHKDYLCSNPDLNTSCERQKSVDCAEGKDGIYWFDSCGNIENIYSSDKTASWNNGKSLTKEQSCNPGSGNIDSEDCGNCDYFLGSRCSESGLTGKKIKDGNYVCKNLKCVDENGKQRENGESWCVYDSYIGDGKDTVGSRHWKRMCINGEIKVEPCADYRGQICSQTEVSDNGKTFSTAACVMNEAILCLEYNSKSGTGNCNENKDCMTKVVDVDEYFKFDMCVGKYPRGFDLTGKERAQTSAQLCAMANQKCTVIYKKDWKGKWYCDANCECETKKFSEQMNDLCISLGDCGSYINYVGDGTDNIVVSGAPSVSWGEYTSYASPVKGQYAEPKDMSEFLAQIMGSSASQGMDNGSDSSKTLNLLGTISGATGTAIGVALWAFGGYTATGTPVAGAITTIGKTGLISQGLSTFGAAAAGFAIGMFAGAMLAKWMGRTGSAATVLALAGGVLGMVIALAIFTNACTGGGLWGCVIGAVIAIIVIIWTWLTGWGKTKTVEVKFDCLPWQAPVGGKNCEKCNDDALKPCSKYRCSSLGKACILLNENTEENPTCQSIPYESKAPVISTGEILTAGYSFQNEKTKFVEIRGNNGECIPEFTPVLFTLNTDEYAQCKFDFERKASNYNEMPNNYPLELNAFTTNHSFGFAMPSLGSLEVYNLSGDLKQMFGNMNMYVRCQDYHGNFNLEEYAVNFCINSGPDLTPARITSSIPSHGSSLKYGATESPLTIYMNEPAECKYDIEDKGYNEMTNTMSCLTEISEAETYGWPCSTNLTGLTNNENTFYIKCKDQPWLAPENTSRNINSEGFVFTLFGSESELKIDSITPSGKIEEGFEPVSVDLEVRTSGGVNSGESACSYSFLSYENMILFYDTYSNYHKQNFNMMMGGEYSINVECEDEAGNIAQNKTDFIIDIDNLPPEVVRVYNQGSDLKIITNEEARCYYNLARCNFDINNATSMAIGYSTRHSAAWILGQTYHIKCADYWGNTNPDCAIIVTPDYFK